MFWKLAV